VRRAHLLEPALLHHADAVRQRQRLVLVVRDEDGGDAGLGLQVGDRLAHLQAQLGVEVGQRLVHQQHLRLDDQRARQRHALALAARQRRRMALCQACRPTRSSAWPTRRVMALLSCRRARRP
jgi:hypothetical protein